MRNPYSITLFAGKQKVFMAKIGSLAQLVERHVYTVDVIGSIPVGPTHKSRTVTGGTGIFLYIHSLRALWVYRGMLTIIIQRLPNVIPV